MDSEDYDTAEEEEAGTLLSDVTNLQLSASYRMISHIIPQKTKAKDHKEEKEWLLVLHVPHHYMKAL